MIAAGTSGAPVAAGGGASRLGVESVVGNVFANGSVSVGDRAKIQNTLVANGPISPGNSVTGSFVKYRYSQLPSFSLAVTYPTTTAAAITLQPSAKLTIGAEYAGKLISSVTVNQNANLTLACGTTYFIDSLTLNSGGRLSVDTGCGPGRIYVKTKLVSNSGFVSDLNGAVLGDIILGYTGTSPVTIADQYGTLVAPNAKVSVANGATIIGAIFAQSVEVHQDSYVFLYPFNFPWI